MERELIRFEQYLERKGIDTEIINIPSEIVNQYLSLITDAEIRNEIRDIITMVYYIVEE